MTPKDSVSIGELQRQMNGFLSESREYRSEVRAELAAIRTTIDTLAPVIAKHDARLDFIAGSSGDEKGGELSRIEGKHDDLAGKLWVVALMAATSLFGAGMALANIFGIGKSSG